MNVVPAAAPAALTAPRSRSNAPTEGRAGSSRALAITGWGLHVPGVRFDRWLPLPADPWPSSPPDAAHELLGMKGLLGKDAATRLALCAVHRALGLPARAARSRTPADPRVAVVVSSNFGNVSTVQEVARTLRDGTLKDISPMEAPNASSNVIASTIAIWFRFGGPNLMVCSGATSGLDAIFAASVLLRADRADRVIVVGVEPGGAGADDLQAARATALGAPLLPGAAAVVLERASRPDLLTRERGVASENDGAAEDETPLMLLDAVETAMPSNPGTERAGETQRTLGGSAGFAGDGLTNGGEARAARTERAIAIDAIGPAEMWPAGTKVFDPLRACGDTYGAQGVLHVALAAAIAQAAPLGQATAGVGDSDDAGDGVDARSARASIAMACGDAADGWRRTRLHVHLPVRAAAR